MTNTKPPVAPRRPHVLVTPNGTEREDPYFWLRDDEARAPEVISYLKEENEYAQGILKQNKKLEDHVLDDMARRVPRVETKPPYPSESLSYWYGSSRSPGQDYWVHSRYPALTKLQTGAGSKGPLSYGPDLKGGKEVVLDINRLAGGFKYCDVGAVKPSPDGRYVAYTVDTVGDERYDLVVQEIGTGKRVRVAGGDNSTSIKDAPASMRVYAAAVEWSLDSKAVFALLLTEQTHEAYKLVRCQVLAKAAAGTPETPAKIREQPEVLLQDNKSGAVLELLGFSSSGNFLMVSRRAEGYTTLLALALGSGGTSPAAQPSRGVPGAVELYGNDPWYVIAPGSAACDVLRADYLYGTGSGINRKETFVVTMDTDKYPDGCVCAVTDGDLKRRTVLVPGRRGSQVVDIVVSDREGGGHYLAVHMLEDMKATVRVYEVSAVQQAVTGGRAEKRRRGRGRRGSKAKAAEPADGEPAGDDDVDDANDEDDDGGDDHDDDGDDGAGSDDEGVQEAETRVAAAAEKSFLKCIWTYSPGDAISSISLDHHCWPGTVPYVRLSYSNLTTPVTTIDLDLAAKAAHLRAVETVEHFLLGQYRSEVVWATAPDGTKVPATLASRADAWPLTTGRPLPCVVQAYGAYGRKLLPDFNPADLAMLDGGAEAGGCGPVVMVIAHVRGGGELGSHWHKDGKLHKKWNTADDLAAVVQMLVQQRYALAGAVALWGRSAGGLAVGMTVERCPPGTFRAALMDVPFLDVLGSMTDPSLPLTIKERPEWGNPASATSAADRERNQEDYDYILSYSPYDNVERVATKTPAILVTCSLHDPRVPYWGPAKYVAQLRFAMASDGGAAAAAATAGGPVLLLTEMQAGGHFAASGASGRLAERAMRVAFLLKELRQ